MRYIELTQNQKVAVDDDLYEWLNQWKWYFRKRSGARAGGDVVRTLHGYDKNGHAKAQTLYMVSLICPVPTGFVVDHADGDPLNNQRHNLRRSTYRNNNVNAGVRRNNKTGIKGVYWHEAKQAYVVQLMVAGKKKWIGQSKNLETASKMSAAAIRRYHGSFARAG